jgi:superfamily I DNA/RNA helicase
MSRDLSPEQEEIVVLPLKPIAVTACAGSGKTKTAVHRLAEMRRLHGTSPGLIALLSFSNVAVNTFAKEYSAVVRSRAAVGRTFAVEIDTMDGFITTNVLRPHGHRVMKCSRVPYLVDGREPFLNSFTVFHGSRNHLTSEMGIELKAGVFRFTLPPSPQALVVNRAVAALAKLGEVGAYTHASARYWVVRTLREQPFVLRALTRRYPHILVDEAQDIGPEHQAILELLISQGTQVSLIGDTHQGIYEFARANGAFLRGYGARDEVDDRSLTVNYRSAPSIVRVANNLTNRSDRAARDEPAGHHGAYYMPFKPNERINALASFQSMLGSAGVDVRDGVILCRSADWAVEWSGGEDGQGQGVVRDFANSAISRDHQGDFHQAFSHGCAGVVGVLVPDRGDLMSAIARGSRPAEIALRRAIWSFVRDPDAGLPASSLVADTAWHSLLCERVRALLSRLEAEFGLMPAENLGRRLARTKLDNRPLAKAPDLAQLDVARFRVSTVHKVKGESLEAVMYVAKKAHVRALLNGTGSEEGRIGYVALTRARKLFVLAVPEANLTEFAAGLEGIGLRRVGLPTATPLAS